MARASEHFSPAQITLGHLILADGGGECLEESFEAFKWANDQRDGDIL